MKLENHEKSLIFSNTEIPDVFFTEYMLEAKSEYIKVYLCMLFWSKFDKDIKLNDLSKRLNLELPSIQSALAYWEGKGVLTKKATGYILNDLQEIELNKLYSPKIALSPEAIENNEKSKTRSRAIKSINTNCFQGVMSPAWYSDIDLWFKKYGFDEQVMISLFEYCFHNSKLSRNYVQAVAEAWSKDNVKTYEDLEAYSQKREKLNIIKKDIAKKLRRYNPFTEFEESYIEKWVTSYGYSMDVINIALKKTTAKANPTFEYFDKLITNWHENNLKTADDVNSFMQKMKEKNKTIKELQKKTNYNNYEQRSYDNLDSLYANKK